MAVDQRVGEILMRADQRDTVPLEQCGVRGQFAQRLTLEHEVGDPADQVLNGGRGVQPQFQCTHASSLYRRNQEMVKHWKKFSESLLNLLA